ncbi:hypothetical protein, partial [Streptomyces viridosporus]|uniref:hypothetical protein n=1 Tax=Streptomyces viridosporus TaxID=67581 RepID=UPI0005BCE434
LLGCTEGWAPAGTGAAARPGAELLAAHPAACDAVAELLGCDGGWVAAVGAPPPGATLTARHPATSKALESLLARA